jgi:hypothetical protein
VARNDKVTPDVVEIIGRVHFGEPGLSAKQVAYRVRGPVMSAFVRGSERLRKEARKISRGVYQP